MSRFDQVNQQAVTATGSRHHARLGKAVVASREQDEKGRILTDYLAYPALCCNCSGHLRWFFTGPQALSRPWGWSFNEIEGVYFLTGHARGALKLAMADLHVPSPGSGLMEVRLGPPTRMKPPVEILCPNPIIPANKPEARKRCGQRQWLDPSQLDLATVVWFRDGYLKKTAPIVSPSSHPSRLQHGGDAR